MLCDGFTVVAMNPHIYRPSRLWYPHDTPMLAGMTFAMPEEVGNTNERQLTFPVLDGDDPEGYMNRSFFYGRAMRAINNDRDAEFDTYAYGGSHNVNAPVGMNIPSRSDDPFIMSPIRWGNKQEVEVTGGSFFDGTYGLLCIMSHIRFETPYLGWGAGLNFFPSAYHAIMLERMFSMLTCEIGFQWDDVETELGMTLWYYSAVPREGHDEVDYFPVITVGRFAYLDAEEALHSKVVVTLSAARYGTNNPPGYIGAAEIEREWYTDFDDTQLVVPVDWYDWLGTPQQWQNDVSATVTINPMEQWTSKVFRNVRYSSGPGYVNGSWDDTGHIWAVFECTRGADLIEEYIQAGYMGGTFENFLEGMEGACDKRLVTIYRQPRDPNTAGWIEVRMYPWDAEQTPENLIQRWRWEFPDETPADPPYFPLTGALYPYPIPGTHPAVHFLIQQDTRYDWWHFVYPYNESSLPR